MSNDIVTSQNGDMLKLLNIVINGQLNIMRVEELTMQICRSVTKRKQINVESPFEIVVIAKIGQFTKSKLLLPATFF